MFIDYTPEEKKLKAELRAYFHELVTPELLDEISRHRRGRPALHARAPPHGRGRLARRRLAGRGRGPRAPGHRAVHLLRRGAARRLPHPLPHAVHGGPDADEVWHRRAARAHAPGHPPRRAALRHRLLRARGRHRSRLAQDARRARRRRLRDPRAEGLHQPRRVRRLHLAGGAHRSRGAEAQGDLHRDGGHPAAGLLAHPHPHPRRQPHQRHVLRRRQGPRVDAASAARTRGGGSSPPSSTTSAWR